MAHLKDPSLVQVNSQLKFDTIQGQNQILANSNKDEILSALLDWLIFLNISKWIYVFFKIIIDENFKFFNHFYILKIN